MGSRRLRRWLHMPLREKKRVKSRLDSVAELIQDYTFESLRESLREINDFIETCLREINDIIDDKVFPDDFFAQDPGEDKANELGEPGHTHHNKKLADDAKILLGTKVAPALAGT